jgi:hypothetical protein
MLDTRYSILDINIVNLISIVKDHIFPTNTKYEYDLRSNQKSRLSIDLMPILSGRAIAATLSNIKSTKPVQTR